MLENKKNNENNLFDIRKKKLLMLSDKYNFDRYPNDFKKNIFIVDIIDKYIKFSQKDLKLLNNKIYSISGRIMILRNLGKASFLKIQDMTGILQLYCNESSFNKTLYYDLMAAIDLGDIIGVCGYLFKTKTNELSLHVNNMQLLTKSFHSLPSFFYGLVDQEKRYRYRYLDFIVNKKNKDVFILRSKVIHYIRQFFINHKFIEVETPMMHYIAGGANAKPFKTYHNFLNQKFYLRIAPELYLKMLVIGGFEKIFEINRNFRNEGVSSKHNPEFTMLEFYQAYSNYQDLIIFTELLMYNLVKNILCSHIIKYKQYNIDFKPPYQKISMIDAIIKYNTHIIKNDLLSVNNIRIILSNLSIEYSDNDSLGHMIVKIFEKTVEKKLINPTFILDYPSDISPLSRRKQSNSFFSERFEFFIGGMEIANGFSELNDSEEQLKIFKNQINSNNNGEDKKYDTDYIYALEHGLPPTAGEGIGIDRLIMILTNSKSIRDVIMFPYIKNET